MTVWSPANKEVDLWTSRDQLPRVFDPAVFDPKPVFDTGQAGGYWPTKAKQIESWVEV